MLRPTRPEHRIPPQRQAVTLPASFTDRLIMTNNQLLDTILKLYLQDKQWTLLGDPRHSKLSFAKIVKSQDPTIEEWQIKFLKEQLFADKLLMYAKYGDKEPYTLTPAGVKAAQTSWYVPTENNRILEQQIKEQTLKSLKRSKTALTISIFAIVVPTLISLYSLWTSKQSATTEELQKLQQRIEKLESSKTGAKTTSNASGITVVDTLKKATIHK